MSTNSKDYMDYMEYLVNQVFQAAGNTVADQRPMEVYVNTNFTDTNLSAVQMKYAVSQLRLFIAHEFTLLVPTVLCSKPLVVFPVMYALLICGGLVTNALMIFAFCRAEKLRTFRNVFIINLAIRYRKIF